MADPSPRADDVLQIIRDEFDRIRQQIRDAATPSGTQLFNAVPKLQEQIDAVEETQGELAGVVEQLSGLVDNIEETLTSFIQNDVAAIVDAAITERLAAPFITIGVAGGTVRIPALYTTDVTMSGRPRATVWTDDQGLVGRT
ncbi:MAG: hypothetical protein K0S37_1978 [Microbacterium sp.]|jgi:hypothetical protein|nr:hypothetical protein [Microbacterium sp.]